MDRFKLSVALGQYLLGPSLQLIERRHVVDGAVKPGLEAPGGAGSCKLAPDETATRWRRTSPLVDPAGTSDRGCLYYQTVLVWSRPGPRSRQ